MGNIAISKSQKFGSNIPFSPNSKAVYQPAGVLGIFLQCLYKASHADSGKDGVFPR